MIFKNSAILAFFSILSLLLAIFRDRLLATHVGVGPLLDIYNASFRIPDLIYGVVLAFVTSATVVPYLTKEDKNGDMLDPHAKLASLTLFFMAAMGVFALIIGITLPLFAHKIVPGFTPEQVDLFIFTTRLLLLQPVLLGVTSLISCLAQMKNHFLLYGLSPLGYSLGIILSIIYLYPIYGVVGLIYGVLIGSLFSFIIQLVSLRGVKLKTAFHHASLKYVKDLARMAFPRTGTNTLTQLRIMFFTAFATTLGPGVLTSFLFAQRITDAVTQVIQQSVTTASLPVLSREFVEHRIGEYKKVVHTYVFILGSTGAMIAVALYSLKDMVVALLYGQTGNNDLISFFLAGFLMVLPLHMMSSYFSVSLYSIKDTKLVFYSNFIGTIVAVLTCYLFRSSGLISLVYGIVAWSVTNFVTIFIFYSTKKIV